MELTYVQQNMILSFNYMKIMLHICFFKYFYFYGRGLLIRIIKKKKYSFVVGGCFISNFKTIKKNSHFVHIKLQWFYSCYSNCYNLQNNKNMPLAKTDNSVKQIQRSYIARVVFPC